MIGPKALPIHDVPSGWIAKSATRIATSVTSLLISSRRRPLRTGSPRARIAQSSSRNRDVAGGETKKITGLTTSSKTVGPHQTLKTEPHSPSRSSITPRARSPASPRSTTSSNTWTRCVRHRSVGSTSHFPSQLQVGIFSDCPLGGSWLASRCSLSRECRSSRNW